MAPRSLRKGHQSIYLQYQHDGHSIGAVGAEVEIVNGLCVVRFTLKPVDENQRIDEEQLHSTPLLSARIDDQRVIDGLDRYCAAHAGAITGGMALEVESQGKTLSFRVTPVRETSGLRLQIRRPE